VIYVGGSSTGGAYQFVGEPDAFFPALVHRQLCGALPAGMGLRSTNFGDGGRDSFTIRRSLDKLLDRAPARLIVAYIGVNDLLGSNNTRTRKEREADLDRRSEAASHLAGWGARSRIITGVGLLLHPPQDLDRPPVADVPLPDAEENLRLIAAEAARRGARLLLLTELVSGELTSQLAPYAALEARIAAELDGVEYFDLLGAIGDVPDSELLVDRNHLSRAGSARVAAALAPVVVAELSRPVVGAP
jgi:lysophospholipase L1-like esterase